MIPREKQRGRSWVYLILAALLAPATSMAATTGNLTGYVTGPNSAPLPGVKVTVSGPALQGVRTATTDAQGFFRFTQLPPGEDYRARFEVTGHKTTERTGIIINIDSTIKLPTIKMQPLQADVGTIEVVEEAPVVEQGSTTIGRTLSNEFLSAVPTGRTTTAVLALAPGASQDARGVTFRGATSPENSYVIDGLNTTGIVYGLASSSLPPEFIQEIQVKTGGYEPEYGRATGGQAIIITKSGGNEFHGDVFAYVTPFYGREHTIISGADRASTTSVREAVILRSDAAKLNANVGFDLGGYIIKDRLWFFVGYAPSFTKRLTSREIRQITDQELADAAAGETLDPDLSNASEQYAYNTLTHFYLANLTFNISQNHSLRLSASGNPYGIKGTIANPLGDTSTFQGYDKGGAMDFTATYNGKFAGGLVNFDAIVGYHTESRDVGALDDAGYAPRVTHALSNYVPEQEVGQNGCYALDLDDEDGDGVTNELSATAADCILYNWNTGGLGGIVKTSANRLTIKPVVSLFLNNFIGNHVFKLGGDMERNDLANARAFTGGALVTESASRYQERYYSNGGAPVLWNGPDDATSYFGTTTQTVNTSAFIQDNWSILSNLTLNLGVRWERQQIRDVFGIPRIDIADNIAPRLGLIFDHTNQGKSKLYANFGRYYESIPQDINDRALSAEGFNYYRFAKSVYPDYVAAGQPVDNPLTEDVEEGEPLAFSLGGEQAYIQSDLKGQYSDQFLLGYEYEVARDLSLGGTLIYQRLGNVIEDISPDNGGIYVIANPGADNFNYMVVPTEEVGGVLVTQEVPSEALTDENGEAIVARRCIAATDPIAGGPVTYCFPKATRTYQAIELTMNKRFSDNWQGQASYTISQTIGNYPGLFSSTNGQLDPNITSQFDLANLMVNRAGYLEQDRRHNIKIAGAYQFNFGTALGLTANVQSGAPISYLGAHPVYSAGEGFIVPRGYFPDDAITDVSDQYYVPPRTPWVLAIDASASHSLQFGNKRKLELGVQVNNILNAQHALRVDQNYTFDFVSPAAGAKNIDEAQCYDNDTAAAAQSCERAPNFGNPVEYQAPFSVRFEAKFSF